MRMRGSTAHHSGGVVGLGEGVVLRLLVKVEPATEEDGRNAAVEGGGEGLGDVLLPRRIPFSHLEAEELEDSSVPRSMTRLTGSASKRAVRVQLTWKPTNTLLLPR